jgi:hypothetical protein
MRVPSKISFLNIHLNLHISINLYGRDVGVTRQVRHSPGKVMAFGTGR